MTTENTSATKLPAVRTLWHDCAKEFNLAIAAGVASGILLGTATFGAFNSHTPTIVTASLFALSAMCMCICTANYKRVRQKTKCHISTSVDLG